jgi:hypothetical protein
MKVSIEQLSHYFTRRDYQPADSSYFCEVRGHDTVAHYASYGRIAREMYKISTWANVRLARLHQMIGTSGGKYICEECYDLLPSRGLDHVTQRNRTRKSLMLPSKPQIVRRLPA